MPTALPSHQPPNNRGRKSGLSGEQIAETGRLALYAVATATAVWLMMHVPEMAAAQAQADTIRAAAMDQENRDVCERKGLSPRTHAHTLCTMDMQAQRQTYGMLGVAAITPNTTY